MVLTMASVKGLIVKSLKWLLLISIINKEMHMLRLVINKSCKNNIKNILFLKHVGHNKNCFKGLLSRK